MSWAILESGQVPAGIGRFNSFGGKIGQRHERANITRNLEIFVVYKLEDEIR